MVQIDPLLLLAGACLAGSLVVTAPLAVLCTVGAVLLLLGCLRGGPSWALLAVAVALGGVTTARAIHARGAFERERIAVRDALGSPTVCAAKARVARSPLSRDGTTVFTAELTQIDCDGRSLPPTRARLYGGPGDLVRGDRLEIVAKLGALRLFRNPELPDPVPRAARHGVTLSGSALAVERVAAGWRLGSLIDRARAHARRRIQATFAPAAIPMARALVLGEDDLAAEEADAFRRSGLAHMLAVSGTHLVFAVLGVVAGLRYCLVRLERLAARYDVGRMAAAAGALLAVAYADFAGGSGSAWRAAWMLVAVLGARVLGRRPVGVRALALSLLVATLLDPLFAFDISLLLSAAATAGLLTLGRAWAGAVQPWRSRPLRYLATSLIATVASMLPCSPLLASMAPELSVMGLLANVVASPLGEAIALPLCLAHVLLSPFPWLERGVALVASGALLGVRAIALGSAAVTWLAVPVPAPTAWHWVVLVITTQLALVVRRRWPCLVLGFLSLGLVETGVWAAGHPRGVLRVTMVDVGQGDAELIDLPDGSLMLIDGGGFVGSPVDPGSGVLLPLLRARRRDRLDVAVLTHPHPDHLLGLRTVLGAVAVGELWDSGYGGPDGSGEAHRALLALLRERGVPVLRPSELCGRPRRFGAAVAELLGPCPAVPVTANANDASLVLRVQLGRRVALLPGDAERAAEAALVARYGHRLRADLLKVGHHGSRTSTSPPFLATVAPSVATVSTDVRNPHGHPHPDTLVRLQVAGVRAYRLDRCGAVTWWTDGTRTRVAVAGCEPGTQPRTARGTESDGDR